MGFVAKISHYVLEEQDKFQVILGLCLLWLQKWGRGLSGAPVEGRDVMNKLIIPKLLLQKDEMISHPTGCLWGDYLG